MNEQDFMNKIDEKTKNLQIPDSISPENMKKMLDENPQTQQPMTAEKQNYPMRRFAAAACAALVLLSGIGISQINRDKTSNETMKAATEAAADEDFAEDAVEGPADANQSGFDSDLAYQTTFHTPDSYEDYFNTVKSAYDAYYDRIATVETNDVARYETTEAIMDDSNDSVSMDAAADYASRGGSSAMKQKNSKETQDASNGDDYSKTNTQEKNIDEGDIIKTDGTYIYRVTSQYDEAENDTIYNLTITKTEQGKLELMTTMNLNALAPASESAYFRFHEFYCHNNQLIMLYTVDGYTENSRSLTYIAIYDVTHKDKPTLVKKLSQSGWYEDSRISDGYLYTITNYDSGDFTDIKRYKDYIPSVDGNTIACSNIYYTDDVLMDTSHVVTSLDLSKPTEFTDSKSIPVNGSSVYVSEQAIYFYAEVYADVTKTEIMKMYYDKGQFTIGSSAMIAGYLYGPFAINEYNGHLRIVATIPANNISLFRNADADMKDIAVSGTQETAIREDVNALYILDENLTLTGKLTGIAPGEIIYSARFMGDTGYFVTYKNTDPLFSVDLSDPANPILTGSLKIPGFSNYLHPYGNGILLGFGEETDPESQELLGLKLSMFDISDPSDVKEEDKYIIEDGWYSNAQNDYKAMMIDPEKNILGFFYFSLQNNDKYYYVTYTYDEKSGFVETAKYEITDGSEYEDNGVRGIYIGDYLYICTNRQITSYKLNSEQQIDKVVFDR
ncbi:MAG: beta-propeller domain-containing protein [Clostridium sp.]|nr:beta-propeller domain-containing protein [Clostridium sp.]